MGLRLNLDLGFSRLNLRPSIWGWIFIVLTITTGFSGGGMGMDLDLADSLSAAGLDPNQETLRILEGLMDRMGETRGRSPGGIYDQIEAILLDLAENRLPPEEMRESIHRSFAKKFLQFQEKWKKLGFPEQIGVTEASFSQELNRIIRGRATFDQDSLARISSYLTQDLNHLAELVTRLLESEQKMRSDVVLDTEKGKETGTETGISHQEIQRGRMGKLQKLKWRLGKILRLYGNGVRFGVEGILAPLLGLAVLLEVASYVEQFERMGRFHSGDIWVEGVGLVFGTILVGALGYDARRARRRMRILRSELQEQQGESRGDGRRQGLVIDSETQLDSFLMEVLSTVRDLQMVRSCSDLL